MGIRHGSTGRFPTRADVILNRFDLTREHILGEGSESTVYAMDADHVLRIYREHINWAYVEARRAFYEALGTHDFPFAVPYIYTVGSWVGHVYTVERRINGWEFGRALPHLQGDARARALENFLDAAAALGSVRYPDQLYGEVLASDPIRHASWQGYLLARMQQTLARSRADLETDVPNFEQVYAAIVATLPVVGDDPPKSLVHGDYWPNNVIMSDELAVTGVVDFSYATVVGDARLDLAGAAILLEASKLYAAEDGFLLRRRILDRWGQEMAAVLDFYRLYYSIFFSGCKADDPTTYWWCVQNLKEFAAPSSTRSSDRTSAAKWAL